jgi:hypothetical protein
MTARCWCNWKYSSHPQFRENGYRLETFLPLECLNRRNRCSSPVLHEGLSSSTSDVTILPMIFLCGSVYYDGFGRNFISKMGQKHE